MASSSTARSSSVHFTDYMCMVHQDLALLSETAANTFMNWNQRVNVPFIRYRWTLVSQDTFSINLNSIYRDNQTPLHQVLKVWQSIGYKCMDTLL